MFELKNDTLEYLDDCQLSGCGEIFNLLRMENKEIAVASYSGLYIGAVRASPDLVGFTWESRHVLFKERMIPQVCEYMAGKLCVAEHSQSGYFLVDAQSGEITEIPGILNSHNSGCTGLIPTP